MDEKILSQLVENQSLDDEVLFLKPDIQIDEPTNHTNSPYNTQSPINTLDTNTSMGTIDTVNSNDLGETDALDSEVMDNEKVDLDMSICWSSKLDSEPCCISVHPKFPTVAHVAVGTCGDTCHIYDFQTNHTQNDGLKCLLGPFDETVSCCAFSPCGHFLALGLLNSSLILYQITHNTTNTDNTNTNNIVDMVNYSLMYKVDTMLLTVDWLSFSVDSSVVCCSGDGGLLIIHHLHSNHTQFINIHQQSHYGLIINYRSYKVTGGDTLDTMESYVLLGTGDKLMIITLNDNYQPKNTITINSEHCTTDPHRDTINTSNTMDTINPGNPMETLNSIVIISCSEKMRICSYGMMNGVVAFVNITKGAIISTFDHHRDSVESILFPQNAPDLCVTSDLTGLVMFYSLNSMTVVGKVDVTSGVTRVLNSNNTFIAATVSGTLLLLSMNKVLKEIKLHKAPITDFQLLKLDNQDYAITIGQDNTITVCNIFE